MSLECVLQLIGIVITFLVIPTSVFAAEGKEAVGTTIKEYKEVKENDEIGNLIKSYNENNDSGISLHNSQYPDIRCHKCKISIIFYIFKIYPF